MPYHNIETALSPTDIDQIKGHIEDIKELLPFLINLTPKERQAGMLGHNNYAFTKAAFEHATYNANLLPPSFSVASWQADIELYDALRPLIQQLKQLLEGLEDTHLALRMESQKAALDFLKLAKIASQSNIPGTDEIVSSLSDKLSVKRKKKGEKPEE